MKRLKITQTAFFFVFLSFIVLNNCQKDILNPNRSIQDRPVVPEYFARTVAEKFNGDEFFKSSREAEYNFLTPGNRLLNIPVEREVKNSFTIPDKNKKPAFYIFNYADGGFVYVSAEYTLQPILAYVPNGEVKRDTVPAGLVMWMEKTVENIEIVREGKYDNSRTGIAAWRDFIAKNRIEVPLAIELNLNSLYLKSEPNQIVVLDPEPDCETWYTSQKGPLVPVTWGQGCSYNNLIKPATIYNCNLSCGNDRPWTGCVATAMAQLIRYWKSTPIYDYDSMPLNSGNAEVQKLMFHAGQFVDMDWGCDGSSANGGKIDNALKIYFGINSIDRIWNDLNIYNTTKENIKRGWPVLLGGCRDRYDYFFFHIPYNCHEWISDGLYESFNPCYGGYGYFHVNWGWHEINGGTDYNGWYSKYNWNLPVGTSNYKYYNDAFVNIHP